MSIGIDLASSPWNWRRSPSAIRCRQVARFARPAILGNLTGWAGHERLGVRGTEHNAAHAGRTRQAPRRRRRTTAGQAQQPRRQLTVEAKALADLKIEKAAVEGERRKVEADLGPVRYLATLLGADSESALRVFILAISLLLDPAAVLLLLAATRAGPL